MFITVISRYVFPSSRTLVYMLNKFF